MIIILSAASVISIISCASPAIVHAETSILKFSSKTERADVMLKQVVLSLGVKVELEPSPRMI